MSRSLAPLYRSLAVMHRAGISWPRAMASAAGGDPRYANAQRALERGAPLSEALEGLVDPLDAALLKAGEQDGSLERVLGEMAQAHEDRAHQGSREWTGLVYPVLLAHLAAVLMALPDLIRGRTGAALSWAVLVLLPTWALLLWRRRRVRAARPRPGTGDPPEPPALLLFWRNVVEEADARGLDALGRLYDAGVPVAEALDLSIAAGWGGRAAADMAEARRRVARGRDLAGAWSRLPAEIARRLVSGEESGSLGEALGRVADELRFRVEMRRKRIAVVLPVLAVLGVGLIVAWRLFSFYAGYYRSLGV